MREARKTFIPIGILLPLVLCPQNVQVVTMHFLFREISMSMVVMLFIAILIGFAIGFVDHPTISKSRS